MSVSLLTLQITRNKIRKNIQVKILTEAREGRSFQARSIFEDRVISILCCILKVRFSPSRVTTFSDEIQLVTRQCLIYKPTKNLNFYRKITNIIFVTLKTSASNFFYKATKLTVVTI